MRMFILDANSDTRETVGIDHSRIREGIKGIERCTSFRIDNETVFHGAPDES